MFLLFFGARSAGQVSLHVLYINKHASSYTHVSISVAKTKSYQISSWGGGIVARETGGGYCALLYCTALSYQSDVESAEDWIFSTQRIYTCTLVYVFFHTHM